MILFDTSWPDAVAWSVTIIAVAAVVIVYLYFASKAD